MEAIQDSEVTEREAEEYEDDDDDDDDDDVFTIKNNQPTWARRLLIRRQKRYRVTGSHGDDYNDRSFMRSICQQKWEGIGCDGGRSSNQSGPGKVSTRATGTFLHV